MLCSTSLQLHSRAENGLLLPRGEQFPVELPIDEDEGSGWQTTFKTDNHILPIGQISSFMPNPATNTTEIVYRLVPDCIALLELYDINGRKITQASLQNSGLYSIDTGKYLPGMYFYGLTIKGRAVLHGKLVVH